MKRFLAPIILALSAAAALAGQVCSIDPPRPAGNTGSGFYVVGAKVYDPTGTPFIAEGVNYGHPDQTASFTGIPRSGANAVRILKNYTTPAVTNNGVQKFLAAGVVPIVGDWAGTCKGDVASLNAIVDTWVKEAPTWLPTLNDRGIVNIANEWGPGSTTSMPVPYKANAITPNYTWRDSYTTAIVRMRAAGYTGLLMVDAGSCGQDAATVIRDGAAVLAADPLHNILFDVHVYGGFYKPATATWQQDYDTAMAALKATGLPIILGEFGPGLNVGPSPTMITPQTVIATADANGWGWLVWSWDDNNLGGCKTSDTGWFGMTNSCGAYTGNDATELTAFGRLMVPMLKASAVKASFAH